MLISYNWLKSYIPDIPKADKVADLIIFHVCEIESVEKLPNGDTVFDVKILPDRAHDLLSHFGFAREIAGLLGLSCKETFSHNTFPQVLGSPRDYARLDHSEKNPASGVSNLKIKIETPNCRRYMGRIVRGIKVGPSPEWMVKYLESLGQRSINNIVDATNIVMFGLGQPIHAFDLSRLSGDNIVIKNAKDGETIDLVGSEKITAKLNETSMMITDGEKNLAIAGVKGGLLSGISEETENILIEVANFEPVSVRKTARRLGILTDASKRFENDLSPELCELAMKEISHLVSEMCPEATFEEIVDTYPNKQKERVVSFSTEYISRKLGVHLENEKIEKILKNYGYIYSHMSDMWEVAVPSMRLDLQGPQDFVEEIGRVYGYDKIKSELPKIKQEGSDDEMWINISKAKMKLVGDGYKEVMTYTFCNKGEVEVLASASDKKFLRNNLTDGLKESIKLNQLNLPLLDTNELKIFEIGTVFTKNGSFSTKGFGETKEEMHVAFGDKKNITEMALIEYINSQDTLADKKLSPEMHGYFSAEKFLVLAPSRSQGISEETFYPQVFKSWSVYPFITRDIAVWVPEGTEPEKLITIYKSFGTELLIKEPKLFDSFTKNSKTSFAFRLVFQSYDRTLTDEEVSGIMSKISEKIVSLGWEVR